MQFQKDNEIEAVLNWCVSVLGPCEVLTDHTRDHPGRRALSIQLHTSSSFCYVKVHRDPSHWASEVHSYEQWASAFGEFAPRLLAVHDEEPLALIMSELPGTILEKTELSVEQEQAVWHHAGRALLSLHNLAVGAYFGPCQRDGTCAQKPIYDAETYVLMELDNWTDRGVRAGYLLKDELAVIQAARDLVPAFAGECPIPCHRDYCPANWLVTNRGIWAGAIDFEFAYWDVRAADFTRYPDWEWINRPDLVTAFFAGYGRSFTAQEEQQRLVAYVQYALGAIVWGCENAYNGFAEEGRHALQHLARSLL